MELVDEMQHDSLWPLPQHADNADGPIRPQSHPSIPANDHQKDYSGYWYHSVKHDGLR
jgi:hypothetical protein